MPLRSRAGGEVKPYSFFNLGTRCGWVVNGMPWLLYPQQRDLEPIIQDTRWATGIVWRGRQNISPTEVPTPDHPALSELLQQLRHLSTTTVLTLNKNVCEIKRYAAVKLRTEVLWDVLLCCWGRCSWCCKEIQSLHLQRTAFQEEYF